MKTNRIIDHRQRIRRVVTYIDDHIDDRLNLPTLAAVACLSPFHFQRVYQQLVGETPADTVRRLRLRRAATQIANGEASVTEAAVAAGYGSSQAFCRAFRRRFEIAPSQLKKKGRAWLSEEKPLQPEFTIVELPDRIGYGLRHGGADWDGGWSCCQAIGRAFAEGLWQRGDGDIFMLYRSDPLSDISAPVDADICLVRPDDKLAAIGLERVTIPGGAYAVLSLPGSLQQSQARARALMQKHLFEAGLVRRDAPILRRLVDDAALTPPSEVTFELYVPIEQRLGVHDHSAEARPEALRPPTDIHGSTAS